MTELEDALRRLALHDEHVIEWLLAADADVQHALGIDARTCALVRLGALIAIRAPDVSYQAVIAAALASGASDRDLLDTLRSVATIVGGTRVVEAAPALARAIGYDLDGALEGYGE